MKGGLNADTADVSKTAADDEGRKHTQRNTRETKTNTRTHTQTTGEIEQNDARRHAQKDASSEGSLVMAVLRDSCTVSADPACFLVQP